MGFGRWLLALTALGAVVRLVWLAVRWNDPIGFEDAYFYHHQANLIAEGRGYLSPFPLKTAGIEWPGAEHPPLYSLYLAAFSFLGATSVGWHQSATLLLGVGTVALIGLAGREAAGDRVGVTAAAIAAVYPHLWYQDAIVWAEASAQAAVALFVLVAFRAARRPTARNLAVVGLAAGLAALTRTELVLLIPLGVLPLAWRARPVDLRRRLVLAGAGLAAGGLVLVPWVALNLGRFDRTTTLSSNVGLTLASANCDTTWYGPNTGYWDFGCAQAAAASAPPGSDPSEVDAHARELALDYIAEHRDRLPAVVGSRLLRTAGLWSPSEQITVDTVLEGRPRPVAGAGVTTWWLAAALALVGVPALRRRGAALTPVVAPVVVMVVGAVTAFASVRYRATAEPAVVLLAAVGACTLLDRWLPRPDPTAPAVESR